MGSNLQFNCPNCGQTFFLDAANCVIFYYKERLHMSYVEVTCRCGATYELYRLVHCFPILMEQGCFVSEMMRPDRLHEQKFFNIVSRDQTDDLTPEEEAVCHAFDHEVESIVEYEPEGWEANH